MIVVNKIFSKWKEIILFSAIISIYTICCAPNLTWIGYDCDLSDFINSAKFTMVTHFPGYPFYTMLAWVANRIPIGSEAFRIAFFLSVIPAVLSTIVVFLVVKKQVSNKFAPYVAALCLAGANIFFMQSIIPETYIFTAFLAITTYALIVYKKFRLAALFGAFTCACHWMMIPAILFFLLWYKDFRKQWKILLGTTIILYLYVVVLGYYGSSLSMTTGGSRGLFNYVIGSLEGNMAGWFTVAIWQIPQRIGLTIVIFCVAFGASVVPMILYFRDFRRSRALIAGAFIPFIYFFGCYQPITIHHLAMAIPFMAVSAGLGVDKLGSGMMKRYLSIVAIIVSSGLLIAMPFNYNIGINLDKTLTATQFYKSLDDIPNGSVILNILDINTSSGDVYANGGNGYGLVQEYDKIYNRSIIPIDALCYISEERISGYSDYGEYYRNKLYDDYGIVQSAPCWSCFNTTAYSSFVSIKKYSELYMDVIKRMAELNPNISVYYYSQHIGDVYGGILTKYKE